MLRQSQHERDRWLALSPHPDAPASNVGIEARIRRLPDSDLIAFCYRVRDNFGEVVWPTVSPRPPSRTDDLWKTTCFEAFCQQRSDAAYREFNFSPSGDWAAYDFASYREGSAAARLTRDAIVAYMPSDEQVSLEGIVTQSDLAGATLFGLSAVIEHRDGTKSYWALAHPPGKPDFHDPACFVLELAALG